MPEKEKAYERFKLQWMLDHGFTTLSVCVDMRSPYWTTSTSVGGSSGPNRSILPTPPKFTTPPRGGPISEQITAVSI